MTEQMLHAHALTKQFFRKSRQSAQNFDAVKDVELTLDAGEMVVLVGRSGSGKTTLLNMLAGLLEPSAGKVWLGDTDLYSLDDAALSKLRNERIGVIPQGHTALHNLNVLQNVLIASTMYHELPDAETHARELLESLDIGGLAESYPSELSGGELRRVAIARALACRPNVVLADEPTGDLDDENTRAVLQRLRTLADDGVSVLLVTHEQEASAYADRVLRMDAGMLREQPKAES